MIYEGGNEYADLARNFTGLHKQTKVAVPNNQIFVKFKRSSTLSSTDARKGFMAFIQRIGKFIYCIFVIRSHPIIFYHHMFFKRTEGNKIAI